MPCNRENRTQKILGHFKGHGNHLTSLDRNSNSPLSSSCVLFLFSLPPPPFFLIFESDIYSSSILLTFNISSFIIVLGTFWLLQNLSDCSHDRALSSPSSLSLSFCSPCSVYAWLGIVRASVRLQYSATLCINFPCFVL